ncbi:MAG TPA: RNA polymerase sigma factor [Chloroflexota bacterium]|nr:RNA polymerase sigma factor [Chloroflexota bacterium]HUM68968.1 RNA polymerase sigma factor [Chloroflexota bacterium]
MVKRSNEAWLAALQGTGEGQHEALLDLRDYLVRTAFVYLRDGRSDLLLLSTDTLYEMAEDYAQNSLLAIQENLDKFRGDAQFTTWAYRFVINEAAADLRRRQYRDFSWEDVAGQETAVFASLLHSGTDGDPEGKAEREEFLRLLWQILDSDLNERQRLAFLGVHFQERSMQEMAEILETTPNTLYKMMHDARKKIKARLLEQHYSAGDILGLFDAMW